VAFCVVVALCISAVGNRRFGGRAASIFRVEVCDYGDISPALLPNQRGFWCMIRGLHLNLSG